MRRWSFVVFILGVFILFVLMNYSPVLAVDSYEDLEDLEINTVVSVSGNIVSERVISGGRKLLEIDNGIVLVCECSGDFEGLDAEIMGVVSEYEGERQIEVLRIVQKG